MPTLTIRTVNSTFFTEATSSERSQEAALSEGVQGAIMIAAEEIRDGKASSVVDVIVEDKNGERLLRSAVMVSVAPLAVGSVPEKEPPAAVNDVR